MKWLRENWIAKVLALIAAIIMWFFVMKEQNPIVEVSYTVPVRVQNLNSQYILEGAPQEAKIVLRGPRNTILALNQHNMHAFIDAAELSPGTQDVDVTFNPPSGTVLESISPESAKITIDEYVVKEFSVEIRPTGTLPNDYSLKGAEIVPKVVAVSGAKSLVNSVAHVYLPVNMDNQNKDFTAEAALEVVNNQGETIDNVTITPHQGAVKVQLARTRYNKTVPVRANLMGEVAPGFEIKQVTVQPAQIVVFGGENEVNSTTGVTTSVIDISGLNKNLDGVFDVVMPTGVTSNITKIKVHLEVEQKAGVNSNTGGTNE